LAQSRIPQKIDGGIVKPTMKHLERKGYKSTLEDEKALTGIKRDNLVTVA
jgi:hypothetical protein